MLHTHLENFKSEHPITAVSLEAQPTKPAKQQFGLFETTLRNPHQLSETLARLIALLGADRVGTPVLEQTHRPDAFRMEPFSWHVSAKFAADKAASTEEKKPALRRFRPVAPASVFISDNWHLQSEKIRGKVVDQGGPYLISGNWWDEKSWERAEWDLQLWNGSLVRAHKSEGTWKIDGVYD
jgi:protein ImuB